jgi:plasmid maintenance system antidote protein VapI
LKLQNPNIPGGELIAESLADLGITISAAAKVLGIPVSNCTA